MTRTTWRAGRAALLCAAVLITGLTTACSNSTYHKVGAMLPASTKDRLALRVHEARLAASDAAEVFKHSGTLTPILEERADAAAWEYSRRVASVEDVLRRITPADLEGQRVLSELRRAEEALSAAVEEMKGPDRATLWASASAALDMALASSNQFLATRDSAYAGMLKSGQD